MPGCTGTAVLNAPQATLPGTDAGAGVRDRLGCGRGIGEDVVV